jgi:heptosyltransferase-3
MSAATLAIVNARIGDTLLVTPALRAIKAARPASTLVVRAHRERAPLLDGLAFVDRVERLPRRALRALDTFARRRYELAFCWAEDRGLVAYCRRVAQRTVAFANGEAAPPDVVAVPRPREPMHAVDERLLLARAVGIDGSDKRLAYCVQPHERTRARAWLAGRGAAGATVVSLQLASFPGKAYRDWPIERFAALARELATHRDDLVFVTLGDANSRDRARELASASRARLIDATGALSLRETAALIEQSRLYVGVDTGPTHLAGALGVPMVALYHCFHRGRLLAPLDHRALAVIEHPCPDAACTRATPMDELPVEPVVAACVDLLGRPDPRQST